MIPLAVSQKRESQNGCYKKKSPPDFPKNEHILSPGKHTCVRIRRKEMFLFRKIWRVFFSCNTRFEIRPFAVLPTSKELVFPDLAITHWYALREKLNMILKKSWKTIVKCFFQ